MKIAQRFNAGFKAPRHSQAPSGAAETKVTNRSAALRDLGVFFLDPTLKRWVTVIHPSGMKTPKSWRHWTAVGGCAVAAWFYSVLRLFGFDWSPTAIKAFRRPGAGALGPWCSEPAGFGAAARRCNWGRNRPVGLGAGSSG